MRELLEAGRELGKLQAENEELKERVRLLEQADDMRHAAGKAASRDEWLELSKMAATTLGAYLTSGPELEELRSKLKAAEDALRLARTAEMLSSNSYEQAAERAAEAHAEELEALRAEHKQASEAIGELVKAEREELERVKEQLATMKGDHAQAWRELGHVREELEKAKREAVDARSRADLAESRERQAGRERDHERNNRQALELRLADLSELESEKARRIEFARESLEQLASKPVKLAELRKLVKVVALKLSASGSCD